jgi:NTE family protein
VGTTHGRLAFPALVFTLALSACAAPDYPNKPLAAQTSNADWQAFLPGEPTERPIIFMAFSGGGTRAAALALSVLQQLRAAEYQEGGKPVRLIDRVSLVSSVSGGSVTAGYFGLYGADGLDGLSDEFLKKDNMAALEWTAANPITWFRLASGKYTRVDALRDLLDREIFHGKTFGDLPNSGRPAILLNATDMASGEVFGFTPDLFNDICSDLGKLPLSVGVAASAAFPVALSPVDIQNFSGADCAGDIPEDAWIATDLKKLGTRYLNPEEYKRARYAASLRRMDGAYRDIHYLHLLDGGVADNQGIHSLMDALFSPHGPVNLLEEINKGHRKRIVVIAVNARSDPASELDQDPHTPGIIDMVKSVAGVPIDSATASLNVRLQNLVDEIRLGVGDADAGNGADPLFKGLTIYPISIDFDRFRPGQETQRDAVKAIGTTWTLSNTELRETADAGKTLLEQEPCYQRLLLDLGVTASFVDPDFATTYCAQSGD